MEECVDSCMHLTEIHRGAGIGGSHSGSHFCHHVMAINFVQKLQGKQKLYLRAFPGITIQNRDLGRNMCSKKGKKRTEFIKIR